MMVAAIMTQWNANPDCWDWGMGWGWAGVNFINILLEPLSYEVFCAAFLLLQFGFVIFWHKNIGAKAVCIMLMKMTTGWSASYCDTCALEHAAVTAHVASSAGHNGLFSEALADPHSSSGVPASSFRTSHQDLFVYDDDNEVAEVGDTDVACDFGGDFGGF